MDWLELSVATSAEAAEAVVELFNRHGQGGAVVEVSVDCFEHELQQAGSPEQVVVKTYLPAEGSAQTLRRVEEGLWHLGQLLPIPAPTVRRLAEEDWAHAWKRHYHALRVGHRIHIVPAWEEAPAADDDVVIRLEPGMAFGTGLHPSTRLCLAELERHTPPGCTVLDVGTGSGVLAIAAARLGASSVLALDIDPAAVAVARENVTRNDVSDRVVVQRGTLPGGTAGGWMPAYGLAGEPLALCESGVYDLVLVNILAPVIVGMAPSLAARTAPGGRLIAAGLIDSQEEDVVRALEQQGLAIESRTQEADWVALVAGRR